MTGIAAFTTAFGDLMRGSSTPLASLIESYLLVKEISLRPSTIADYRFYLCDLDRFLGGGPLSALTPLAVARYVGGKQKAHPAAARLAMASLKAFATWLAAEGYLEGVRGGSVLSSLKTPRSDRRREGFSDDEVRRILAALSGFSNRTRARDRAVVLMFLGTGLRASELRLLCIPDTYIASSGRSYLLVRGETSKSKESRKVPIDPLAANALHVYLEDDRPDRLPNGPLFLTEEGRPFTESGFQTLLGRIKDRLEEAGIVDYKAHRCRHTWATSLHRNGHTPFDIRQQGGWRDLAMVQRYTHDRPFEEIQQLPTSLSRLGAPAARSRSRVGEPRAG